MRVAGMPSAGRGVRARLRREPVPLELAPRLSLQQQLFDIGLRMARGWTPTVDNLRQVYGLKRTAAYRRLAELRTVPASPLD